jgi:hypothetical protein
MAGTTLDALPPAIALGGNELVLIYQPQPGNLLVPYVGLRCTTGQIAGLATSSGVASCSMRQLLAALSANSLLNTAFNALSTDINNYNNLAWNHAYTMTITDAFVTSFLEPTIGYTSVQMAALFAQALTFAV